jgi:hypothetical protein
VEDGKGSFVYGFLGLSEKMLIGVVVVVVQRIDNTQGIGYSWAIAYIPAAAALIGTIAEVFGILCVYGRDRGRRSPDSKGAPRQHGWAVVGPGAEDERR